MSSARMATPKESEPGYFRSAGHRCACGQAALKNAPPRSKPRLSACLQKVNAGLPNMRVIFISTKQTSNASCLFFVFVKGRTQNDPATTKDASKAEDQTQPLSPERSDDAITESSTETFSRTGRTDPTSVGEERTLHQIKQ